MISWIDSDIEKFSTGRHFQNGHHNTTQIQHCPFSTPFHMWVDYDVPNWFLILKNFTGHNFQNGHQNIAKIQHCPISWQFDMWVDNDVPNWFQTLNNFYWSPFSKWPPQYRKNSTLSDIIKIWYVGRICCPELIPDIEKVLPVAIFKMATTISQKINIFRYHHNLMCG